MMLGRRVAGVGAELGDAAHTIIVAKRRVLIPSRISLRSILSALLITSFNLQQTLKIVDGISLQQFPLHLSG